MKVFGSIWEYIGYMRVYDGIWEYTPLPSLSSLLYLLSPSALSPFLFLPATLPSVSTLPPRLALPYSPSATPRGG